MIDPSHLSPKTGWSKKTLAKLVESFIPYMAAEAVFRLPKMSWQEMDSRGLDFVGYDLGVRVHDLGMGGPGP